MTGLWEVEPPTPESRIEGITIKSILARKPELCARAPDDLYATDDALGPVESAPEKFVTHVTVEKDDE